MKSICSFSVFLASALGAAIDKCDKPPPSNIYCNYWQDKYEDVSANPKPFQSTNISDYHFLVYSGWSLAKPGKTSGLAAQSKPNVAAASVAQDFLEGDVTLHPFGTISKSSGLQFWSLFSFYFGCVLKDQSSFATPCTISISGYDVNDCEVAAETHSFTPTEVKGNQMQKVQLGAGFGALHNVTISVTEAAPFAAAAILDIDDLTHCNFELPTPF